MQNLFGNINFSVRSGPADKLFTNYLK